MKVLIQFENKPRFFSSPDFVISCFEPSSLKLCFAEMEQALSRGYYLAGFLSYEAGYCFEDSLPSGGKRDFPLLCFGAYKEIGRQWRAPGGLPPAAFPEKMRLNISRSEYASNIGLIRDYIARGDVYQITYCIKLLFEFSGCAFSLYSRLLREQPVPYPAYIEEEKFSILSLSPELFIKKQGGYIMTKPMKGTWPRGGGRIADILAPLRLKYDLKNRAENVMIADLLRNDLGRLGSDIRAPALFEVARYKTLCQMTSTVTAKVDRHIPLYKLFSSVFPSGSVTGTPKIRAMEIIGELEKEERKIYTGAIGYITPDKDMFFNIPIRTLLIQGDYGQMGIGGGIVWDSTPEGEWNEGLLKASFFTELAGGLKS
jgi:para-aminobenzoate synthetase/4-amino-4-deoxychorismate lyase